MRPDHTPPRWTQANLSEVAEIDRQGIQPADVLPETAYVGLEHVDGNGCFVDTLAVRDAGLTSTKFLFGPQHILYGKLRPYLRKIARPTFSGICSTDILPIRPRETMDRGFLYHYLRRPYMVELATKLSAGANLPRISPKTLEEFIIPVPPLPEQRRIAAILDKADAIRRKRQQASGLAKDFLRSSFLELLGNPLSNPKRWKTDTLSSIAEVHRGRFSPRPRNDPKYYGGLYPFIQTGEIAKAGGYLTGWRQSLNEDGVKVSRLFPRGTVVIAIVGATIGETAILDFDSYAPDSVVGIETCSSRSTGEYIEFLLRFWRPVFLAKAPETARANINLETIRPLEIPVPPIELQVQFSKIYRVTFDLCRKLELHSTELFESLSQRAFRGEL